MSDHLTAVMAMEAAAQRVAAVTRRLLAATGDLPGLLAVRPRATHAECRVELQPDGPASARLWARRLGVTLTREIGPDPYAAGCGKERVYGETVLDGVTVYVGALRIIERTEWAALQRDDEAKEKDTPAAGAAFTPLSPAVTDAEADA
ncbi:hypothetical protein [Streptomyces sp. NRRL F-5135]|uniref:hypothetical protein n=1 Tax=Streptomyces sp. NRRL F-5135 TaxID=1463858 RepID=UPI0004C9DD5B|nr:hypothetical protein [Streptomyces sp. NRRL F-5135]